MIEPEIAAFVREATGARAVLRCERVQSLWGGYGELVRLHLDGGEAASVVLKVVSPPPRSSGEASRGDEAARSHARKCRSYDVELAFYGDYAGRTTAGCRVPRALATRATRATRATGRRWLLLLEDLDAAGYPLRRRGRDAPELAACLRWLAAFHACFLGVAPLGLWPEGTYWQCAVARRSRGAGGGVARALPDRVCGLRPLPRRLGGRQLRARRGGARRGAPRADGAGRLTRGTREAHA